MRYFSFKNRIASAYILSTAILIGLIFGVLYLFVRVSVFSHLDEDLQLEVNRHSEALVVKDGVIALKNHEEWMEREHNTLGVDPVFVEFTNAQGEGIDKSPNLKTENLLLSDKHKDYEFYDSKLLNKRVRQVQLPIVDEANHLAGYLLVAVSLEGRMVVLDALSRIIWISYPLVLIALFFVARIIVGRSIRPINSIIETSNKITRDNLVSRIPLPENHDELFILSQTINDLLDRVEQVIEREKLFTSYASHEFRTPLAVLKGTLEVMIRKPRSDEEYRHKVNYCLREIDRLDLLIDQLLLLTRYESQKKTLTFKDFKLKEIVDISINRIQSEKQYSRIYTQNHIPESVTIYTDAYIFSTILDNILSNAFKYSKEEGKIDVSLKEYGDTLVLLVQDYGQGIAPQDLEHIFDDFYRANLAITSENKGFGLGLSIVKRLSLLLNIDVSIKSESQKGTIVSLTLHKSKS
ncbi:HAMP domain-containing sensor histidine kinase [Bacteroides sp.]|uniref:sensor histidine kinase n=1 Tax=Bacteroides sp. TaxID=29523 RepID=UPI0025843A5A|nr:HAMP domain-containing sensor histidine kinase [Bacteroides sp.]